MLDRRAHRLHGLRHPLGRLPLVLAALSLALLGPTQLRLFVGEATELEPGCASPGNTKPSNRHPWAWLLQRVFAVDVMTCPRCRGAMKLIDIANEREAIARALANAGFGPRPPPRSRPPLPGQLELKFAA